MTTDLAHRRPDCDVLIIGGGVNGTGLARDLSLRGLRVILLERNDLAFGASGNSSGMIHGGPRYLTTHPSVTRSSCVDSGYIQTIAPHMIFRTPFVMPVYGHGPVARVRFDAFDAFFSLYDEYQPLKRGKPHTRLTPAETPLLNHRQRHLPHKPRPVLPRQRLQLRHRRTLQHPLPQLIRHHQNLRQRLPPLIPRPPANLAPRTHPQPYQKKKLKLN